MTVETFSPSSMFAPIGPYDHVARAGNFIMISATPGVDGASNDFTGSDAYSQTKQIVENFRLMLAECDAQLCDVLHVHVFLKNVEDFQEMNRAFAEGFGTHRPARSVVAIADLPKKGALLTMNLTAIAKTALL